MKAKDSVGLIAFIFLIMIIFVSNEFSFCLPEISTEITDLQSSETAAVKLAVQQPFQALPTLYDNSQSLRICSGDMREAGRYKIYPQTILLKGREVLSTNYNFAIFNGYVYITACGDGRVSVLALSYGSNSPPVFHI